VLLASFFLNYYYYYYYCSSYTCFFLILKFVPWAVTVSSQITSENKPYTLQQGLLTFFFSAIDSFESLKKPIYALTDKCI